MSIPTNTGNASVTYEGNGSSVLFTIPFTFSAAAEIAVYLNGAPATGVTVYDAGNPFGGTVTFAAAPAPGDIIRIRRLQTVHVSDNDTAADALVQKLVAGNGIALTEIDDGDNETLEISVTGGLIPSGLVSPFAGTAAPTGWLLCDGSAVSRSTYAALFGTIGMTYGAGDGTTTFNLPDLRGRVAAGKDNMGGTAANRLTAASAAALNGTVLGGNGGNQQHQLTMAELASHTHAIHLSGTASSSSGANEPHTTGPTKNTAPTGGDQPHNNVQPTLILNYIIKV
jgi:microcystin-dependent protein